MDFIDLVSVLAFKENIFLKIKPKKRKNGNNVINVEKLSDNNHTAFYYKKLKIINVSFCVFEYVI